MRLVVPLLIVLIAACDRTPPAIGPVAGSLSPADLPAQILDAHNRERAAAKVMPLLWDHALTAAAGVHARRLAVQGALRHSPRESRQGQGENLWIGTRGTFAPRQMVGNWASEKAAFRPGLFPAVSRTGNWVDVGHYSQMIWPTTTRLGCAIAVGARFDVLVCRYSPAGNIDGRRVP